MKTRFLFLTIILCFLYTESTHAQIVQQRAKLQKTIDSLESETNWPEYIQANINLLKTYQGTPEFKEGERIGEQAYLNIKTQAPEFRKECGSLLYHIGLTYPYPYQDKALLKRFSDAKNLIRNHDIVNTLLLVEIYNNMGLASIKLNDIENGEYYLLKAQELLGINENTEITNRFGTYSYNTNGAVISSDTTFGEYGEIVNLVIAAVSSNPPFYSDDESVTYVRLLANNFLYLEEVARKNGDFEKSIFLIEKSLDSKLNGVWRVRLNLALVEDFYRLGLVYFELKEYEQSSFYFNKVISMINNFSELIVENPELKFKEDYYKNRLLPECNYYVGKNNILLERWEDVSNYFEDALTYIGKDTEMDDLEFKIFTGFVEYHFNKDYPNVLNDTFYLEIIEFIDTSILKSQPLVQANNVNIDSKVYYNFERAKIYHFLLEENQKAIDILNENLKIIPTGKYPSLKAETHLKLSKYFYSFFGNDKFDPSDSIFYHNQQALISVCEKFDNPDFSQIPDLEDIKDLPIVQEILIHKGELMLEKIQSFMGLDWVKPFYQFAEYHEVRGLSIFHDFIKQQLEGVIAVTDLADKFHEKQLRKANFIRAGNIDGIVSQSTKFYRSGVFATHYNYLLTDETHQLKKGFYYAQKMKGQRLQLNKMNNLALRKSGLNKYHFARERRLNIEIAKVENSVFDINKRTDLNDKEKVDLRFRTNFEVFGLKRSIEILQREMESSNPDYANSKYQFFSEDYSSLQEVLTDDELIIEFVVTPSDIFVMTISRLGKPEFTRIENVGRILSRLKEMKNLLENSTLQRRTSRISFIEKSNRLYQYLLEPIEEQLKDKKRLIIIGDSYTNYLPFEILLKTDEVKPFKDLDFLIKDYDISYHYSSTLLADARRTKIEQQQGIYAFAPVYDEIDAIPDTKRGLLSSDSYRAVDNVGNFRKLPDSEIEVLAIMQLFEQNNKSENNVLALRKATNETAFKANLKKPYKYIHIAGHSFANTAQPKFSGIACYQIPDYSYEDGTLYTSEIYNINIKADLVTLSSCESGVGKLDESDGLIGLNRAFIQSGTPNVVFSLWNVYDKVSADVMIDFYGNILSGLDYSESLRDAKLKLLEKEETASPHFWSPYLLIGR